MSATKFILGPDPVQSVKTYYQGCLQIISEKMDAGVSSSKLVGLQSSMMDRMLATLFNHSFQIKPSSSKKSRAPLALFALGGYGREELNIYSDLDLLFIYEGKVSGQLKTVVEGMFYPLWDAGIELGYAIRTMGTCEEVMRHDSRTMSSTLDARFLMGDPRLGDQFKKFITKKFSSSKALARFIAAKTPELEECIKRYGNSVYLLEPNIKESEGGLRDWHMISYYARIALQSSKIVDWVQKGLISQDGANDLLSALEFLWGVRNRLHRCVGSAQDTLIFGLQEPIAKQMGFEDDAVMLGVERFMQSYYGHAANLHRLASEIKRRLQCSPASYSLSIRASRRIVLNDFFWNVDSKIVPKNYAVLEKNPVQLVRAFYLAQKQQLTLNDEFKFWISRHLRLIDDDLRRDPEVCGMLREMFEDVSGIGVNLWEMHESRFLGAMIPEFGEILFQTQHDAYHIYTVDTHLIFSVGELSKLYNDAYRDEFQVYKNALDKVVSKSCLVLSTLFHDLGKGKGGHHSEKGALLAKHIMMRMGYDEAICHEVEFLVLSHLLMPKLSQRRDLEDLNMIVQFAQSVGTIDRLNMLFLLTWADIRAVGPEVWTPWKGGLLAELYTKTYQILESKDYNPERAANIKMQMADIVLGLFSSNEERPLLKKYLEAMPPRYFLANKPQDILEHFHWVRNFPSESVVFWHTIVREKKINYLHFFTSNTPKLFEQVTGVLAKNKINILALEQYFNSKGEVLIILQVSDDQGNALEEPRRFHLIQKDLQEVLEGRISIASYQERHKTPSYLKKRLKSSRASRIEIDNDISPYYTIIDIYTNDRVGLLNDIARAMSALGLYTDISKVATQSDWVTDVFYVKDIFGHKITDKGKLEKIKKTLCQVVEVQVP